MFVHTFQNSNLVLSQTNKYKLDVEERNFSLNFSKIICGTLYIIDVVVVEFAGFKFVTEWFFPSFWIDNGGATVISGPKEEHREKTKLVYYYKAARRLLVRLMQGIGWRWGGVNVETQRVDAEYQIRI